MATVPGAMLLCLSTPYSRSGALWSAYRKHFGKAGDTLVWQADTRTMNPSVPQSVVDDAYAEDPAAAASEYNASFRSDLESYITQEVVDAVVVPDRYELPPVPGARYFGFCDPSGGSGSDAFTLAVGHTQGNIAVLDLIRERKPRFSPEAIVAEFSADLKRYNIHTVVGDRFGGDWPGEAFRKHGINYKISERTKSEIYQGMLPMLNSRRVELLDNKVLRTQLIGLERRTARSGRDSIDHRFGGHDDVVNSAAGCLVQCAPAVEFVRVCGVSLCARHDFVFRATRRGEDAVGGVPMITIAKNATEEIRLTCVELEGRSYMDIRIFEGKADKVPTRKGITLRMDQVPELIDALQKEGKESLAALAKRGIAIRPGLVPKLIFSFNTHEIGLRQGGR